MSYDRRRTMVTPRWRAHAGAVVIAFLACWIPRLPAAESVGTVRWQITDADSRDPIPARVHLRDSAGRAVRPSGFPFWHDHFVMEGSFELPLAPGEYRFDVERGHEYRPVSGACQADSIGIANNHQNRSGMLDNEAWGRPRELPAYPSPQGNGYYSQDLYYRILNAGLRLPPSGGSASGVLPNPVGYNRTYVQIDGALTWEKWWEGLRAGRVFVGNGPLLRVRANGQWPGATLRSEGPLLVTLEGRLDSRDPIATVELVRNGRIERVALPARFKVEESGWFLIRAVADVPSTFRFASTGAWYVEIGGKPLPVRRDAARFFLDWTHERKAAVSAALNDPTQRASALQPIDEAVTIWQDQLDGRE